MAGPIVAQAVRVDRSGRHQLDRRPEGRRARRLGDDRPRRRARGAATTCPSARSRAAGSRPHIARLDPKRSKPWWPWHKLTRAGAEAGRAGRGRGVSDRGAWRRRTCSGKGHRICLDITSMDLPTGVAGATNAEYVPYHICSQQDGRAHASTTTASAPRTCCCRSSRRQADDWWRRLRPRWAPAERAPSRWARRRSGARGRWNSPTACARSSASKSGHIRSVK